MQGFFRFEQKNFGKKSERETVKAWMVIGEVALPSGRNGTCQPEPREWRRKRIEDGPKGAESRVASKAKDVPPR
jgi:hypothetical protein